MNDELGGQTNRICYNGLYSLPPKYARYFTEDKARHGSCPRRGCHLHFTRSLMSISVKQQEGDVVSKTIYNNTTLQKPNSGMCMSQRVN